MSVTDIRSWASNPKAMDDFSKQRMSQGTQKNQYDPALISAANKFKEGEITMDELLKILDNHCKLVRAQEGGKRRGKKTRKHRRKSAKKSHKKSTRKHRRKSGRK